MDGNIFLTILQNLHCWNITWTTKITHLVLNLKHGFNCTCFSYSSKIIIDTIYSLCRPTLFVLRTFPTIDGSMSCLRGAHRVLVLLSRLLSLQLWVFKLEVSFLLAAETCLILGNTSRINQGGLTWILNDTLFGSTDPLQFASFLINTSHIISSLSVFLSLSISLRMVAPY